MLEVSRLKVRVAKKEVLSEVSFSLKEGDFMALVGPNGAGKSTLVKTILGLIPFEAGEIKLFGEREGRIGHFGVGHFNKIGYLPQKNLYANHLMPASAEEIVFTGIRQGAFDFRAKRRKQQRDKLDRVFEDLAISHLKKEIFNQLSGGEQQKILLARALVDEPRLLILDEPTVSLDEDKKNAFLRVIKNLNEKERVTLLFITHSLSEIRGCINKLLHLNKEIVAHREMNPARELSLELTS